MKEMSRKFVITLLYLLTSILLVFFNKIPPENWIQYVSYVVIAYMGGNVGEWFVKSKGSSNVQKDN